MAFLHKKLEFWCIQKIVKTKQTQFFLRKTRVNEKSFASVISVPVSHSPKLLSETHQIIMNCVVWKAESLFSLVSNSFRSSLLQLPWKLLQPSISFYLQKLWEPKKMFSGMGPLSWWRAKLTRLTQKIIKSQ